MKSLPVHLKMGLPIPVINTFGFGEHDFTTINTDLATALAQRKRCGLCSHRLDGEAAFLGGYRSAEARNYSDPPMHPACAEAAIQLCPHINRRNMQRAGDHRLRDGVGAPDIMSLDKPDVWVMSVVPEDDYQITLYQQKYIVYIPGKETRRKEWTYNDEGRITPVNIETGEIE